MYPIFDLHCDLLHYLAEDSSHTPNDAIACCAVPQLRNGGVALQTLALYTPTERGSHTLYKKQLQALRLLLSEKDIAPLSSRKAIGEHDFKDKKLHVVIAVENAAGLLEADESISLLDARLDSLLSEGILVAYISMTWKEANRFGGGDTAPGKGLTGDGMALLEAMASHGMAIDVSHASDALLVDILNHCDKKNQPLKILASHSNSRAVCPVVRNLPDELLQELFYRKALVGLHVVRRHVGGDLDKLAQHLQRMLECGGKDSVCCGFDYFAPSANPLIPREEGEPFFISEAPNASHSQQVLLGLQSYLGLSQELMEKLAWRNAQNFFKPQQ